MRHSGHGQKSWEEKEESKRETHRSSCDGFSIPELSAKDPRRMRSGHRANVPGANLAIVVLVALRAAGSGSARDVA